MKIINSILNTKPLVLHAQGISHYTDKWCGVVNSVVPNTHDIIFPDKDKITILTFTSGFMATALDRQLTNAKIDFIDLAKYYNHEGKWTNQFKIKYTARYLSEITTSYVLILDSIDILLSEDLTGLLDTFKTYDCDILLGASINCHPPEIKTAEKQDAIWKYLNAGTVLGRTSALKEFYTDLNYEAEKSTDTSVTNEQLLFKIVRREYDNIKCDTECKIFQTLGCCGYTYNFQDKIINVNSLEHE